MTDPIAAVIDGFIHQGRVAGASLLLLQNGREVYYYGAGYADLSTKRPFTRDTLCHMFSTSKPVVAAALLTLAEEGRLSLSDPVSRFIPAFSGQQVAVAQPDGTVSRVPVKREVTLYDLMTMTSGIPYPGEEPASPVMTEVDKAYQAIHRRMQADEDAGHPWGTLEYIEQIAACPLCFQPGEDWLYGLSCDVIGGVIEAVTGMTLGQYLHQSILAPLGMDDTFFLAPPAKLPRVATLYTDGPEGLIPWQEEGEGFRMIDNPRLESGGAGLISTADDYGRFGQMLLEQGNLGSQHLLRPQSVKDMMTAHLTEGQLARYRTFNNGDEFGYSYGYMVRVMQHPAQSQYPGEGQGAFGWNGMAGTSLRIDPAHQLVTVFMTQRVPPDHKDYLPALSQAIYRYMGIGEKNPA